MEIHTAEGIMHKGFREPSLNTDFITNNNPIFVTYRKHVTNSLNRYWPSSLSSSSSSEEELKFSTLSSFNPCASGTTLPHSKHDHTDRTTANTPFLYL